MTGISRSLTHELIRHRHFSYSQLSQRYVPARQLPDKAVSLLDTACARVAVSQHATPAPVEDRKRRVELLNVELDIVRRESEGHYNSGDRITKIEEQIAEATTAFDEVTAKWESEKSALEGVQSARTALTDARTAAKEAGEPADDKALTKALEAAIELAQQGAPA